MRILHVVPSLNRGGGGPSASVPMTAIAQKEVGLDVAIAFYDDGELSPKAREAEHKGVRLVHFKGTSSIFNPVAYSSDFTERFEALAREYDVIHTHIQWMFPVWWAAHVALKLKKPLVMMPRGCFAPERLKISRWKKKIVGAIDRRFARSAAAVWATSGAEAEAIRAYVPEAKVEVFPIGLDASRYRMSRQSGRTLLFLSRISYVKGLDILAEAWGRIDDHNGWRLVMAGPDDRGYTEEAKRLFKEKCKAGTYEFRPPVYGDDKIELLTSSDAFILPTRNENWGIAVAEAMASGLPVICTKGAPWECLEKCNAGWWTDVSAKGIEMALRELVSLSAEKRMEMGGNGRKWVLENLDWTVISIQMRSSYESMVVSR